MGKPISRKIHDKGQGSYVVCVPMLIVNRLDIRSGDSMLWEVEGKKITIRHVPAGRRPAGPEGRSKVANQIIDMMKTIEEGREAERPSGAEPKKTSYTNASRLEKLRIK